MNNKILPLMVALSLGACASTSDMVAPSCPVSSDAQPVNVPGLSPVAWDDARSTFLRFPGHQMVPVITVRGLDGKERAVGTTTNPETGIVTVHGVYPTIILRDNSRVACIHNRAFDQVGRL